MYRYTWHTWPYSIQYDIALVCAAIVVRYSLHAGHVGTCIILYRGPFLRVQYGASLTALVDILYPIPVHTPRMYPVVAHAPFTVCYYTALSEVARAVRAARSTWRSELFEWPATYIAIRYPTILHHTYTTTNILVYRYFSSPTHPPLVFIPAYIGVRALRRANLICIKCVYRVLYSV